MDSNIDESITKIYEKQQTMNGSEEEALQFLNVLDNHEDLNVNIEGKENPIKIPLKSWEYILLQKCQHRYSWIAYAQLH